MKIISKKHPATHANCDGDPTVYSNITWISTSIPQATLDNDYLDVLKEERLTEIDKRTGELISLGFQYTNANGTETFSLSELAQINWIGLNHADVKDTITYPLGVSTKDDGEFELIDAPDVTTFFMTGVGTKKAHIDSGRALKVSIKNAVDEAAVNAIIDNR